MGRRAGEYKETVTIRLTPQARQYVKEILQFFQATRGWNNTKVYTNSFVIEQAIGHYRNFQRTMHETQGRLCGCCGHPKPENRQEQP